MRTTAYALDALSDGLNEACLFERWLFWEWTRPSNELRGDRIFSIALALRPLYKFYDVTPQHRPKTLIYSRLLSSLYIFSINR